MTDKHSPSPRARPDLRGSLFSSFSIQSLFILLRVVQQILLVPVLIAGWGADLYQDWIILSSGAALVGMLDLGLQVYFGNALMIAWSRQDIPSYRRHFATALFLYGLIIVVSVVCLTGTTLLLSWPDILGSRRMEESVLLWTFLPMVAASLALIPLGLFGAIYRVHGDYLHGTIRMISAEAARGLGVCLLVVLGGTPVLAGWGYLAVAGLLWMAIMVDLTKRFGPLPISWAIPSRQEFKTALAQSGLYLIPTIVAPVVLNIPVILLGRYDAESGAVVAFSVARTFAGFVRQVIVQMCHPLGSEMARQQAVDDPMKLRRILIGGGRLTCGIAGLLSGVTLVISEPFIGWWTRGAVAYDPWLVAAFLMATVLTAPAQIFLVLFLYNNKPGVLVLSQGSYAIGTVLLCGLLISGHSALGAAIGIGLAELLTIGLMIPYAACRQASIGYWLYLGRSYLIAGTSFAGSWGVAWSLQQGLGLHKLPGMIVTGIGWAAIIGLPSFFLLLSPAERAWCRDFARQKGGPTSRRLRRLGAFFSKD